MIRRIREEDRELYYKYADMFYNSDVVNAPVPKENYKITFDEFMRSDDYVWCYIFECEGKPCGFAMMSKTFSQEAGGVSVTVEEIFIEEEYRNSFGSNQIPDEENPVSPYANADARAYSKPVMVSSQ